MDKDLSTVTDELLTSMAVMMIRNLAGKSASFELVSMYNFARVVDEIIRRKEQRGEVTSKKRWATVQEHLKNEGISKDDWPSPHTVSYSFTLFTVIAEHNAQALLFVTDVNITKFKEFLSNDVLSLALKELKEKGKSYYDDLCGHNVVGMQVDYAEEEKEYFHPVTDMPISKENYDKAVQEGSDLPLPYEDYELDT